MHIIHSVWSTISMCSSVFYHTLFILVIQLSMKGLYSKPSVISKNQDCPTTGVPINERRGTNLIYDTKPLYKLDMENAEQGYTPGNTYQLYVKAQDPNRKFTEVLLSTRSDTENCGMGTFDRDPELQGQPPNCSHIVYKATRSPEHTLIFSWTAPQCGCVNFRVRVKSSRNIYYLDDAEKSNGFLSQKICSKDLTKYVTELPVSKRFNILCAIIKKTDILSLSESSDVLTRRKLNFRDMSLLEVEDLKINLHRRSEEVRECCSKNGQEKYECFGDIRRLRIDQFCEDGEPIIPFTITRLGYMTQHKKKCCWRLGERRYACFAESGLEGAHDGQQADWVKRTNILDESDPLNDIADYPTELSEQLNKLNILPNTDTMTKPDTFHKYSREYKNHQKSHTSIMKTRPSEADEAATTVQTKYYTESTIASTTQTTEELFRAMQRAQMSYECCNSGKKHASDVKVKDYWKMCEKSSRKYSRSRYTKGRGKCRRYYHQCCVEQVHLLQLRNVDRINPEHEKQHLQTITTELPNRDLVSIQRSSVAMTQELFNKSSGVTQQHVRHIQYDNETFQNASENTSLDNARKTDLSNDTLLIDYDKENIDNDDIGSYSVDYSESETTGLNIGGIQPSISSSKILTLKKNKRKRKRPKKNHRKRKMTKE
ncbi:hypothetical protein KUTeg_007554 [Tegillarca granosa]|uniref:Reelin domain-containing protein n=1 Tax=Tegillarca granosa TaxID=220873 RepID=A0ABQ9FDM0_TEGGR|nr:hypothetical protein KUTeg_007554 [Tegillarca granosa]